MITDQLNNEYAKIMIKAENANGRKEAVSLLHKADRLRTAILRKHQNFNKKTSAL